MLFENCEERNSVCVITETKFDISIYSNFLINLQNNFLLVGKVQNISTFKGQKSRKSVLKIDFISNF